MINKISQDKINMCESLTNNIQASKQFNKIKGNKAESLAVNFLKQKGYIIVETNYKNKIGEIDIIAKDKDRYVFIEVKYRATLKFGYPRETVTYQKQKRIKLIASVYLKSKYLLNVYTRFDVIEILADKITHIQNAF